MKIYHQYVILKILYISVTVIARKMPSSGEVKCLGCSKWFLISGIQAHLQHAQKCKIEYSSSSFKKLKELCEAQKRKNISERKAKNYKKLKEQKNECQKEHISPSEDSSLSSISLNVKHKCKGCLREFTRLVVHLEMKPDCLSKYYQRELEIYKRQKRNKKQKQCYNRKKMKTNEKEVGMKNQVVF